jgi:hypothetical protein
VNSGSFVERPELKECSRHFSPVRQTVSGEQGAKPEKNATLFTQNFLPIALNLLVTDPGYPAPHRPTLDLKSATTDRLIARVRSHRQGQDYPTLEQLPGNLPAVLRGLRDHVLSGEVTALDIAYRLASLIDAVEGNPTSQDAAHRTP